MAARSKLTMFKCKIRNLADTNSAVSGPLTKIHIVKGGSVKDTAIVPDG